MSKDKCGYNLDDLVVDACESFDNDYDWGEDGDNYDVDETMHEIADNAVPIYYYDIGLYAANNSWLMTETPHIMSDGTAIQQIRANIYTYIYDGLQDYNDEKEGYVDLCDNKQEKENKDESK